MSVELPVPLSLDAIRSAPAPALLEQLQTWVKVSDPVCLVHPHGFFVILLHRSDSADWRFHWWPKGPRTLTGMPAMIHTHDKLVESRLLAGKIKNVLYDVTETTSGGSPVYEVAYRGDKFVGNTTNVLQKTAMRVRAEIRAAQTLAVGQSYSIEPHVYHEAVVPDDTVTATIVCMHSPMPGAVSIIGLDGYPEQIEFNRTECRAALCMGLE